MVTEKQLIKLAKTTRLEITHQRPISIDFSKRCQIKNAATLIPDGKILSLAINKKIGTIPEPGNCG